MNSLFATCLVIFSLCSTVLGRLLADSGAANGGVVPLMHWGDYAYFVSSAPASYQDAEQACAAAAATLANINTPYESFTLARRFAGSDFGDHQLNAYTAIDWSSSDVYQKMAVWIGNSADTEQLPVDNSNIEDIWTYNPTTTAKLVAGLDASGHSCTYLESTKYNRNGVWRNDESCDTKMHFVCKKPIAELDNQVSKKTIFASLTLDCLVSPLELTITHIFNNDKGEMMVFIPYPQTCFMKGVESSTAVVATDIEAGPMPIRYYIVDATRKVSTPFEGGIMTYVGSMEEVLDSSSSSIL
eukprot:TRINITY_DN12187_c0_g2_i1.p2 TRINITY_DN12187_c0_g2~~TRINITY_DN12187_c0_g2_i1.p2  ORF type:complete len:299 (-),score=40.14 TRINITY_DN12187_c0_g2_i1:669-1565(-)